MPVGENRGAFLSFLDTIDELSQVPKNLLRGNLGAAGRHTANILGNVVDSVLPGDWIPDFTKPEDYVSSSDLVGIDQKEHPFLAGAANFVGDTLLNPATYIPGAAIAKGAGKLGSVIAAGVGKLPEGAKILEGASAAGRAVRSTFGAQRISNDTRAILDAGRAAKTNEAMAGIGAIKGGALSSLTPDEANIVGDVMDNFKWKDGKIAGNLADPASSAVDRVALHPDVTPENAGKITDAVKQAIDIGQNQAKRPNIFTAGDLPKEYLGRSYTGQTENQSLDAILGTGRKDLGQQSAVKARSLETPEDVAQYLADNPKVQYERNAIVRLGKRAEQQGTLAQRAEIGKSIVGEGYAHADPEMRAAVMDHITKLSADAPEDAKVLMDAFKGIPPRGKVMNAIASTLKPFKQAAVYGFAIPKVGSLVRNALSGVWQAAANPESRGLAMKQFGKLDATLGGAVADSLGFTYPRDQLVKTLRLVDHAFSQSGGLADNAVKSLEGAGTKEASDAAGIIRSGVLDGFVRSEDMIKEMARTPFKQKLKNIADWPGVMFRGVEDRMRAGMYLDLVGKGKSEADAVRIVRDSLYDYNVSSVANRNARDFIPFFQFQAKAIPQSAKLIAEKPFVGTAMASALGKSGSNEDPIYPYMEGKLNIPLGADEQGNNQYATGFGLPFESLNSIPASWRDVKRNVVGSSNPVLKSLFAAVSGEDPYFESPYGSYDKMPIAGHQGDLGRDYNMAAGTGLIQPLDAPLHAIDQLIDGRRSAGIKALDLLTGANIASVDPHLALQQQLQEALKSNPDVRQYRGYFADAGDSATQELIKAYQDAKAAMKAKRLAQK